MYNKGFIWILTAIVFLSAGPVLAAGPESAGPSEALLEDAAWYAGEHDVDLDEAVRLLELQHAVGDLDAALSSEERGSFAGLWIEHEPVYRVIVRFTDPFAGERMESRVAGGPLASLVEVRKARWSLADLEERQAVAHHMAAELEIPVDSDINVFENRVEVYAVQDGLLKSGLSAARLRLPDGVEVVPVEGLIQTEELRGGASLSTCTGGFTVRRYTGDLGISTAAHCSNAQSYLGTTLPFRGEDMSGNQDVQWHSACDIFDVDNQFNSGIGYRACTGTRHRNNQAIGSYVCKWGKTTGRTCGFIQSKSIRPSSVNSPSATFVRVDGGSTNLSSGGDSGGPWFLEDIAYGTHLGSLVADPNDAVYMPINYISSLGVSVLTYDPGPGCNLVPSAFFTYSNPYDLRVDFNASGSSDPDGSIVSYFWDFGDGTTQTTTSSTVTHWYMTESSYFVELRVTDNEGGSDSYFGAVLLCDGFEIECEF